VDIGREDGAAVVVALMASGLLLVLGTGVVLTTTAETSIAASFRNGSEAFYAADAAFELAVRDLQNLADWNPVLDGSARSTFVDGGSTGSRVLPDGATLDLGQLVNLANCQKATACSVDEMNAVTVERPWGSNNPRWRPYAYGNLSNMVGTGTADSSAYVLVLAGDDPSENDGDPTHDGLRVAGEPNPGLGALALRVEAFGRRGAHHALEIAVARTDAIEAQGRGPDVPPSSPSSVRVLSWRHVR
jgi:hypothetical protein